MMHELLGKAFLVFALLSLPLAADAQDDDRTSGLDEFSGSVTVTSKGISTVPNLTLGRPAAIFNMTAGKNGLSFEPEFRSSLDGQPWSFLFWWRYDIAQNDRFRLRVGAHPAISFAPYPVAGANEPREITEARRFLAGELATGYQLTPHVNVGTYYLYGRGFERTVSTNTHYLSLNTGLSTPSFGGGLSLTVRPQVYYLRLDARDGFYTTLTTTLVHDDLPLSLSSVITTPIQTGIEASPDLLWNVSLIYAFDLLD